MVRITNGQAHNGLVSQQVELQLKMLPLNLLLKHPAGGSDLGKDMQIDIPTLADVIAKAGVQKAVKDQLGKEINNQQQPKRTAVQFS